MLAAGSLDRRVTLLRSTLTPNVFNEGDPTWVEIATVWGSKTDVSDRERLRAEQIGGSLTTRFRIRWSSRLTSLDASWRVRCEGVTYDVTAVRELDRRVGLEISAVRQAQAVTP